MLRNPEPDDVSEKRRGSDYDCTGGNPTSFIRNFRGGRGEEKGLGSYENFLI